MDDIPFGLLSHPKEPGPEGNRSHEFQSADAKSGTECLHLRLRLWMHDTLRPVHPRERPRGPTAGSRRVTTQPHTPHVQLANTGTDWRVQDQTTKHDERPILSLFADDPQAPFSIHRFVEHGAAECGKYPGEWFGPSATARCIQDLVKKYPEAGLKVYNTGDGADVYEDKLKEVAVDQDGKWHPTLILVGTRLGIEKITPVYWEALKASLQMEQSIGIAG